MARHGHSTRQPPGPCLAPQRCLQPGLVTVCRGMWLAIWPLSKDFEPPFLAHSLSFAARSARKCGAGHLQGGGRLSERTHPRGGLHRGGRAGFRLPLQEPASLWRVRGDESAESAACTQALSGSSAGESCSDPPSSQAHTSRCSGRQQPTGERRDPFVSGGSQQAFQMNRQFIVETVRTL